MEKTDKTFSPDEVALLKSIKGDTLDTVDACIVARGDMAWNTVRLHFGSHAIDVNNILGSIVVDELGTLDEFGLMTVAEAPSETLDIPEASPDTTVIPVGKTVRSIRVVNDVVTVYGNGKPVAEIRYPQAVVLDLGDESLVLDKEVWFSETLAVKAGTDASELVYDDTINWADDPEEDPTTHYEASTETIEL